MTPTQKFLWNVTHKVKYMTAICKPENLAKLRQFTNAQYTDPNTALKKLTEIITDVGKESLPLITISGHKNDPNKVV